MPPTIEATTTTTTTTTAAAAAAPTPLQFATARPYAYTFSPSHTALVLIDIQRDFVDPGGFGAIQCGNPAIFSGVRSVVDAAQKALTAARRLGLHVVHTREGHVPDLSDLSAAKARRQVDAPAGQHTLGIGDAGPMGRLLVRGEYGHDIVDELRPRAGEVVIDKSGKGSFWATDLHRKLMARGVTHLLFCGVTTECCVTTTAREANDRGFQCCILSDCTGGFDPNFVTTSLDMICSYDGLFGFTASSSELLQAAAENPPTPPASPPVWDEKNLDISVLTDLYQRQILTPQTVVETVFRRIEEYAQRDSSVWICLRSKDAVLEEARALESMYEKSGDLPPLYGIPFAVKDNFDVAGLDTTAACPDYTYASKSTAPVVEALSKAGALLIGKTNMDQLATGLSGCRSPFGTPASVYGDGKCISGGSSSGSGVAVAANLVSFSLGTDTAGSGRVPAALNGIIGYKPTKGTLSARGIVPACRSLDTASIFAGSVEDARRVWYITDQHDDLDAYAKTPSSLPLSLADYRPLREATFVFAVPPTSALEVCSPSYREAFQSACAQLEAIGGRRRTLSDEEYGPFRTATKLLYSGSLVAERVACIGPEFIKENLDRFHPTTKTLFGAVLSRETKPWDVFSDQLAQAEATSQAARLFSRQHGKVDVLVTPTVPCHPTIAEMEADPIGLNAKMGEFTHFGNVLDLCSVSVNASFVSGGMPFGLSLVCGCGMDGKMFDIATEFERAIDIRK
ncbi:amidase signature domain-containing protein [Xylariomycetidae sp. FL2044]|nr:amidase signature domain-containing protein [Xylariomycetidae sp. FL2044]